MKAYSNPTEYAIHTACAKPNSCYSCNLV